MAETYSRLHIRHYCITGAGGYRDTPIQEFGTLIENFCKKPIYLTEYKAVEKYTKDPAAFIDRTIRLSELLGVVGKNVYSTRNKSSIRVGVIY